MLDLGCGRGTLSFVLAKLGYRVFGVDIYFEGGSARTSYVLEEAVQKPLWNKTSKLCNHKAEFKFYDGLNLPFEDDSFDCVFTYAVLEHVENLQKTLSEIGRVLKRGGVLFVSRTPNKYSYVEALSDLLGIPAHDKKYSKKKRLQI